MFTQSDLNTKLDSFIKSWQGKKASYPNGKYTGECLSLAKKWVDVVAGKVCAPVSGNGWADGYYSNFPNPLSTYFSREKFNPARVYPRGTLVIYAKTHHIAILNKSTAYSGTTNVFEQNANPDGSAAHLYNRANTGSSPVTGVLVPKVAVPHPATNVGKTAFLSKNVSSWAVYPLNKPPVHQNAIAHLDPAKFDGLAYKLLATTKWANTYTIQTEDYGKVNIYLDSDATIK